MEKPRVLTCFDQSAATADLRCKHNLSLLVLPEAEWQMVHDQKLDAPSNFLSLK